MATDDVCGRLSLGTHGRRAGAARALPEAARRAARLGAPAQFQARYQDELAYLDRIRGASIYPAVQNIILACRALGLGTLITTNHLRCEEELKSALGLPAELETFALMPIGYPIGKFGPLSRRPVGEVAHADRWSAPWPG